MIVIGLTGGIGTGKSRVARLLGELGAEVLSADQIAREVVEPGRPAYAAVVARFGPEVVARDGTIDRRALAERVFSDEQSRKDLEAIVHPAVRAETAARLAALRARPDPPAVVVVEVPLLFEAGRERDFDEVWVVRADEATAVRRAASRDGVDEEHIRARLRAQWPLEEKVRRADVVIDNDGDWEATAEQVRRHWRRLERRLDPKGEAGGSGHG
ncbi:MAG TPA: dephospho-CoA kinase [Bacillota bacterium]